MALNRLRRGIAHKFRIDMPAPNVRKAADMAQHLAEPIRFHATANAQIAPEPIPPLARPAAPFRIFYFFSMGGRISIARNCEYYFVPPSPTEPSDVLPGSGSPPNRNPSNERFQRSAPCSRLFKRTGCSSAPGRLPAHSVAAPGAYSGYRPRRSQLCARRGADAGRSIMSLRDSAFTVVTHPSAESPRRAVTR